MNTIDKRILFPNDFAQGQIICLIQSNYICYWRKNIFLTKRVIHLLIKFVTFLKITLEILFSFMEELLLIKIAYSMKESDIESLKITLSIKNEDEFLISTKNEILGSNVVLSISISFASNSLYLIERKFPKKACLLNLIKLKGIFTLY